MVINLKRSTNARVLYVLNVRSLWWLVENGLLLTIFLLPILFNPWAALPFEPVKVAFLRAMVCMLGGVALVAWLTHVAREQNREQVPSMPANWAIFRTKLRHVLHVHQLQVLGLGYGLLQTIAALRSNSPSQSLWGNSDLHGAITLWALILFFCLLSNRLQKLAQLEHLFLLLMAGTIPICGYGLSQLFGWDSLPWITDSVSPVLSTLGRSNFLGAYLAIVLPCTVYFIHQTWQRRNYRLLMFVIVLLLLQLTCLGATLARAGWLAFVAGTSLYLWLSAQKRYSAKLWLQIVTLWLVSGLLFSQAPLLLRLRPAQPLPMSETRASAVTYQAERADSIQRRFIIWQHSLPLIQERPLLGYGSESFVTLFNQRYPPGSLYAGDDAWLDDPHNIVLDQLLSSGILGVCLWFALIGRHYQSLCHLWLHAKSQQTYAIAATMIAMMTAYLVQAQFNPDTITLTACFWLLLACEAPLTNR